MQVRKLKRRKKIIKRYITKYFKTFATRSDPSFIARAVQSASKKQSSQKLAEKKISWYKMQYRGVWEYEN